MRLTKNEKKVLKSLINNSRTSDSEISLKLNISSQAVGKIRRKLESEVIRGYTLKLDYGVLGIQTFAVAMAKLTTDGMDKGELEVEQILQDNDHIINVFRLPRGRTTHVIIYGFTDINEFDNFFHSQKMLLTLHNYLEIVELYTFSHNSLLKNDASALLNKAIDCLGTKKAIYEFEELENFKRRLI